MCISPITIPNPYYGLGDKITYQYKLLDGVGKPWRDDKGNYVYHKYDGSVGNLNKYKNTHNTHIQVPCGHCQQCLSLRQNYVNQRIQMESLRSHLFMLTYTYNDRSLMHTNCGEYQVAYPYYKDIQNTFKRMRNDGYKFRYYVISEYGSSEHTARPHYHAIIAIEKSPEYNGTMYEPINLEFKFGKLFLKYWKRNYNDNVHPIYDNLLDYKVSRDGRRTYDFHYVRPILGHDNDLSFYVSKYLWKYNERIEKLLQKISLDPNLSDDQAKYLTSCIKPRSVMSKDFGSYKLDEIKNHITKSLETSDQYPQFLDLHTGNTALLSPYYRKHLLPLEWKIKMHKLYSQSQNSMDIPDNDHILEYSLNSNKSAQLQENKRKILSLLAFKY